MGVDHRQEYHCGGSHIYKHETWYESVKAVEMRMIRMSKINKVGDRLLIEVDDKRRP